MPPSQARIPSLAELLRVAQARSGGQQWGWLLRLAEEELQRRYAVRERATMGEVEAQIEWENQARYLEIVRKGGPSYWFNLDSWETLMVKLLRQQFEFYRTALRPEFQTYESVLESPEAYLSFHEDHRYPKAIYDQLPLLDPEADPEGGPHRQLVRDELQDLPYRPENARGLANT